MRPIVTARSVVCLSVCVLVTQMCCAKTGNRDALGGLRADSCGSWNHVLDVGKESVRSRDRGESWRCGLCCQWMVVGRCGVRGPSVRRLVGTMEFAGVNAAVTTHYLSTMDGRVRATPSRHQRVHNPPNVLVRVCSNADHVLGNK